MPVPSLLPIPPGTAARRAPLLAQDASYLAESARICSLRARSMNQGYRPFASSSGLAAAGGAPGVPHATTYGRSISYDETMFGRRGDRVSLLAAPLRSL